MCECSDTFWNGEPMRPTSHLARHRAGVRAQAIVRDGSLLDDFCFSGNKRILNVINAPSSAATASLSIGEHIVRELEPRF